MKYLVRHTLLRRFSLIRVRFIGRHLLLACLLCTSTWAQLPSGEPATPSALARKDPLGRSTPRGTVLGFLLAAGKKDNQVAAQYLNAREGPKATAALAGELYVVLNRRLPARLNEISDRPEGTATSLLRPDLYLVGTINGKAQS